MRKYIKLICVFLILLVSLSCRFLLPNEQSGIEKMAPTPTHKTKPTQPDPTEAPVNPTETPAPTSLNPQGPYILYQSNGIWISNPDGSFLKQLTDLTSDRLDLHRAISPSGDRLAMVVFGDTGLDLVQVAIPSGETKTLAHLLKLPDGELNMHPTSDKAFVAYSMLNYDSFAWQPGSGQLLAFTGAITDPTSDLYTYDTQTEKISQLTNGPSQAVSPNWSPDGQYILHAGGSWVPPFGGAIGPYTRLDGVWAVQLSDGKVITEPKPKGLNFNVVGWQDDTHYITFDSNTYETDEKCFSPNLRSVDVVTGKATPLMRYSFDGQVARSPENQALLFAGTNGCPDSLGDGTFLLLPGQSEPVKLLDKKAYQIEWLPESGVFQAYPETLFSADGNKRYDPPVYDSSFNQAISRQGFQAWKVIENRKSRAVVKIGDGNWKTILSEKVDELIWDPIFGNTLLIGLEDGTLYAATAPDFIPRKMGGTGGGFNQLAWVP